MSLDPDLEAVARLALHLPEAERVALAGAGAMLVHGLGKRPIQDIDLFTPDPAELARLVPALVAALHQHGYDVRLDRFTPTFARVEVTTPAGRALVVDLAQDWRMRAPVSSDVAGAPAGSAAGRGTSSACRPPYGGHRPQRVARWQA